MLFKDLFEGNTKPAVESGPLEGNSGTNLNEIRERAGKLLAAGDEAINNVLSANHENFLLQSRQRGGQ